MKKHSVKTFLGICILLSLVLSCAVVTSAGEVVEIEFWHRWTGGHNEQLQQIIDDFNAQNPSIRVKNVPSPGEYLPLLQRILTKLAAGEAPPDMVATGYFLMDYTANTFGAVNLGRLPGCEEIFDRYIPATLEICQVDGKQCGVPLALSNQVLYYNPEIFEAAGLDPEKPPKTWDELYEYAKIIKDKTDKYALYIQNPDTWMMAALIESNGGRMKVDGRAAFNGPEAVEVMEMWARFYREGLIPQISYNEAVRAFQAGQIAMHPSSIMGLVNYRETSPWLRVSELPSFGSKPKRQTSGGAGVVILSREAKRQDAAWEFIKYLSTVEAMETWVKTGYLSPLKADVPLYDDRQIPAYEQLGNMIPWVNWPGPFGLEMDQLIMDWRDKILFGQVGVEEGLNKAVEQVNSKLRY